MYKNSPLSTEQVEELRMELYKILQQNMMSFQDRIASSSILTHTYNVDTLFEFSREEHQKMIKLLQNVTQFTLSVMSNFDMVWEEVFHRQAKIEELRRTFSQATTYIEELRCENDDIKNKLSQAQTYIQWVQQQKEYLDAIYETTPSSMTVPASQSNLNRCVSESSLRWSRPQRRSVNYQKLKDYIQSVKEERNNLQKQYLNLNKKYETKCQQSRKANLIIEHLVERLNRKVQFREYASHMNLRSEPEKSGFTSDDILKILEKQQQISSATSLQNHLQMIDEEQYPPEISHFFDSYSQLADHAFRDSNRSERRFSSLCQREGKDVEIGTESQLISNPVAETQTQNKEIPVREETSEYKISIHISGLQGQKNDRIAKVLKDLDLQQQLSSKLQQKNPKKEKKIKQQKMPIAEQPSSFFDYYCKKYVTNRIKKYSYKKPECKIPLKNIMVH